MTLTNEQQRAYNETINFLMENLELTFEQATDQFLTFFEDFVNKAYEN